MAYPSRFSVSVPLGRVERPGDDTPPEGAFLQASNRAVAVVYLVKDGDALRISGFQTIK